MKSREVRGQDTLARVRDFAIAEVTSFPSTGIGGQLFTEIFNSLDQLDAHIASQVAGSNTAREGTEQKELAQEELLDLLMMIRRSARSMDHANPGVYATFRVPPDLSATELLGVAETFGTEALPLKTDFIAYGMPATFLDNLEELSNEVREALDDQMAGARVRVTSTMSIKEVLEKGFTALRRVDPIVRNIFRDQPAKLAAWESARHLERAPRRQRPSTPASSAGTPPVS
jgi:hypothetical protein